MHSHSDSEFLNIILDNYKGSILITDETGTILACSKGSCQLMCLPKNQIIGKTMTELKNLGIVSDSAINKCILSHTVSETFLYPNGDASQAIYAYAQPIYDDAGKLAHVIAFSQDEKVTRDYFSRVETLLKKQIFSSLNTASNPHQHHFIASSKQSQITFDYAKNIAEIDTNVILYGESGTGKEVIANYIHQNSSRKDCVFVPVNCAAIPEALIESEIFGYEKGSFTGANKEGKIGLFELADKGTLFLDEIGELPLSLQPKLLRVLETGEIRRLGSNKTKTINIRLIAATNRNLREMVDKGTFREDLYYRLNVFPIHVPPLRERKEDIEPLINYYMQIYNRKYNRHVMINDKDIRLLSDYSWPGNIRELKNVIQRYIITDGHFFLDSTSTTNYHRDVTPQIFPDTKKDSTTPESIEFKDYIASCEKKYFEEILSLTNGDVSKAAAIAHLHISSIYKKCDALGLVPKDYKNNSI